MGVALGLCDEEAGGLAAAAEYEGAISVDSLALRASICAKMAASLLLMALASR